MNRGGQFACFGDEGEQYMWRAVGLERQHWLSLMLTMIRVKAHAHVLALDTDPDFGYSDVMLEDATDGGTVVSVDEQPAVTQRAHYAQLGSHRPRQLSFHTGPLNAGWPDTAPYDLVVSLCPFGWLPNSWLRQCRPGAQIVQVLELELPDRLAFLHVDVDEDHQPSLPRVLWRINGDLRNSRYAYSLDAHLTPATDADGYDIAVARYS